MMYRQYFSVLVYDYHPLQNLRRQKWSLSKLEISNCLFPLDNDSMFSQKALKVWLPLFFKGIFMPPELSENQKCHFLFVSSVLGGMSAVNNFAFTFILWSQRKWPI